MTSPETEAKGRCRQRGHTRPACRPRRASRARATIRRASSILKPLSPEGFASASAASAARRKARHPRRAPARIASAARARQGFSGDAAEREARFRDRAVLDRAAQPRPRRPRRRRRCAREPSGNAHARRNAPPPPASAPRRSSRRAPARSRARARRRATGERSSSAISRRPALPSISTTASSATSGTQKSDGCVAMQLLAPPEHGVQPVLAAARVAARAGLALVAGAGDVVEVGAARPLQEIAADRRGIAQAAPTLPTAAPRRPPESAGRKPASCARSALRTSAPIRTPPSARSSMRVEPGKMADVDSRLGRVDAALHQVQQVGAGRRDRRRPAPTRPRRFSDRRRPHIVEGFHATSLRLPKPNAAKPAAQCGGCRTPRLPPTSAINCIAEHDQSASAACRACKKRRTAPSRSSPMAISYARRASPFAPVRANSSARAAQ